MAVSLVRVFSMDAVFLIVFATLIALVRVPISTSLTPVFVYVIDMDTIFSVIVVATLITAGVGFTPTIIAIAIAIVVSVGITLIQTTPAVATGAIV